MDALAEQVEQRVDGEVAAAMPASPATVAGMAEEASIAMPTNVDSVTQNVNCLTGPGQVAAVPTSAPPPYPSLSSAP